MVYIKGLKFRGFKSFRRAEASFPRGYVCLAGPNGSGKSNVTDAIRFALGESSFKALRAKRASELINTSCKFAEVTLFIDGEQQYEIRRGIMVKDKKVKTLYRINGKRSNRTLVMEELRQYGLEGGSHNIIAQGQVQKIVEMNAKERRQIIDSVAGISEFDAKKDEALRELSAVDQKINEANIVLGERTVILNDLEKEKDDALAYLDAQEGFKRSMASIANLEYAKLNKSFTETVEKFAAASVQLEEVRRQASVLQKRLDELSAQKAELSGKIGSAGSREALLREIEETKVAMGSDSATVSEKKREAARLSASQRDAASQIESLKKSQKALFSQISSLSGELSSLSSQAAEKEKQSGVTPGSPSDLAKKLEFLSEKIVSLKEQLAGAASAVSSSEKMLQMKKGEKETLSSTIGKFEDSRLSGERGVLSKEVLSLQAQLDTLMERERELNRSLPEIEKRLLTLKEKAATLRASVSPAATSLALRAVEEMKQGGMKGIFGPVSSLVKCDAKYSTALEAAAAQRLSCVVVDRMDTAIAAISKLKEQKSGRCTFIPLDMPKQSAPEKHPALQGCLGFLIDFVEFDAAFQPAMLYVFGETLLFDTVQSAKKAGVGRHRMVSLEGELIEKSGTITGGSLRGSILSKSALDRAESEAHEIESQRKELYAQLYSLREAMNAKRKEKAESEVKLRGTEIEMKSNQERKEGAKKALAALSEIDSQVLAISSEVSALKKTSESLSSQLQHALAEYEQHKKRQSQEQEAARQADSESQMELRSLHSKKSALEEKLSAKKEEHARLASELSVAEGASKTSHGELEACKKEVSRLEDAIAKAGRQLAEREGRLSEMSAASQKLYAKLKELESQSAEVGQQLGKVKAEEEKKNRELMEHGSRREITQTRLADLQAALEQYAGVPLIDAPRTALEELSAKSKATMDSFGAGVNLRAPELYEQKKKDIEEVKARTESLSSEKNAVMHMMDEIEAKKRAIFLSTFTAVNGNFQKLFGYAFSGEGAMVLEQPSSPFDAGLLVRVREGDGREKYLDSMSGGEKSLLALMFIFSIQMHKAAPFYILDEADAALDKPNSKKFADLVKQLSRDTQFLVVTHNDTVLSNADVALGVTKTEDGSKIVGVQLTQASAVARPKKA